MKLNRNALFCTGIFSITLLVYILTLSRSIAFTDSGELAAVASSLGIAHPTGYPLFTIIGHIWTLLPLPLMNIVKLNLLSAILIAASNVFFFHSFRLIALNLLERRKDLHNANAVRLSSNPKAKKNNIPKNETIAAKLNELSEKDSTNVDIISLMLALAIGFSQVVWQEAVSVEVYALHYFMLNISMFFALKGYLENNFRFYIISSFMIGLGFTNHLTTLLILPPVIFLFFSEKDKGFQFSGDRFKQFLILLAPLAIGLSVYLYMPIRSAMEPQFNWGDVSRGFDKFLYHVSGKQYQVWMFTGSQSWADNFNKFFGEFISIFGLLHLFPFLIAVNFIKGSPNKMKWVVISLLAPIAYPLARLAKQNRTLIWFLLIMIASGIAYSFNYSIHDIDSYFYSAYWAIFILLGLSLVLNLDNFSYAYAYALFPLFLLFTNYKECDKSNDYAVEEYTRTLVENLPENSIIISAQWDYWCSAFWYLQKVEGLRPDIVLVEKELMRRTWYPTQFKRWHPEIAANSKMEFSAFMNDLEKFESGTNYNPMSIQGNFISLFNSIVDNNFANRPVFITLDILQTEPDIAKDYMKIPIGYAFQLRKNFDTIPLDLSKIKLDKFIKSIDGKSGHLYDGIREAASANLVNLSKYAYVTGQLDKSRQAAELARKVSPNSPELNELIREMK